MREIVGEYGLFATMGTVFVLAGALFMIGLRAGYRPDRPVEFHAAEPTERELPPADHD